MEVDPQTLNRPAALADAPLAFLESPSWQMSFGERAAVEGVLAQLRPRLSIELGTAQGGSLTAIARHSQEVHSFDLLDPGPIAERFPTVHFHTGDSHELLPQLLADLAGAGRNVDFVLVDGDHTRDGVLQDVEDLLGSPALAETIILIHDTSNPRVRSGCELVRYEDVPKVAHVDLDFVGGYVLSTPGIDDEVWGGLGLVWVSAGRAARPGSPRQDRYHSTAQLLQRGFASWRSDG